MYNPTIQLREPTRREEFCSENTRCDVCGEWTENGALVIVDSSPQCPECYANGQAEEAERSHLHDEVAA
jgi:formylmethanofuran dehydrogenase subunit E